MTNPKIEKFLRGFCNFLSFLLFSPAGSVYLLTSTNYKHSQTFQEMTKSTSESWQCIFANGAKLSYTYMMTKEEDQESQHVLTNSLGETMV